MVWKGTIDIHGVWVNTRKWLSLLKNKQLLSLRDFFYLLDSFSLHNALLPESSYSNHSTSQSGFKCSDFEH
jgi:hypothetical protein